MSPALLLEQQSFRGKRVLVLGLGRFSGGLGTVRFLCREGADVLVSDRATRKSLAASADEAEALGARLLFGPQDEALLEHTDLLLANPAIPFEHPLLAAAKRRGIPTTTEINIVLARSPAPVYAVTGTKGKSTTSTLLARMLEAAGHRVHLGGNIGRSLVADLEAVRPEDRVVLELSSFQLYWTRALGRSPHVTVVTNLMSDHLDRHGTQAAYAEAKRAALDFQGPDDIAVLPADDRAVREAGWMDAGRARRVLYGEGGAYGLRGQCIHCMDPSGGKADLGGMALPGPHNLRNALAAATALLHTEPGAWRAVREGALATQPLPHRMQPVAEVDGVLFLDDSNATHPQSTLCALEALDRPVVLIAGGKEKGADPAALVSGIGAGAKALIAIGSSAAKLEAALAGCIPVTRAASMEAAVAAAAAASESGDVVLLSPAYSSLDQFASFADRGDRFQRAVRSLEAGL